MSSYDLVPYSSFPFSRTHPDNLAVMATLFGMAPAAVETCRVLELGCAAGGNLLPMAEALPRASFHGIDLSARQIEQGQAAVAALGLENLTLERRDILDVGEALGSFDYIICHGVYSWVPERVREAILAVCRARLAPHGIAYISYNTLPGWHMRAMVREMMVFHAQRFDAIDERIAQSRALLDFLSDSVPADAGAYGRMLHDELEILRPREDTYLFHEHLEEHNEPVYFYRFMERANAHGLRYLGEAQLADMLPGSQFPAEVEETLRNISSDIVHMEQYLDFLRNRMFRRTLLCHAETELERELGAGDLLGVRVATALVPAAQQPEEGGMSFEHPDGARLCVYQPLEQSALLYLRSRWPASVTVTELARRARDPRDDSAPAGDVELGIVAELMLNCLSAGLVEIKLGADRFITEPGERPCSSALARYQARDGYWITNRRHESVQVDELGRQLLLLMDGEHDRNAIADGLVRAAVAGELVLKRSGQAVTEVAELKALLAEVVDEKVAEIVDQALLIA